MRARAGLRILFIVLVSMALVTVGYGFLTAKGKSTFESHLGANLEAGQQVVPPGDGITVVATDSNSWRGLSTEGPRAIAELVAFNPDGSVRYYDRNHTRYWDVDPVKGTSTTVEYAFSDHRPLDECPTDWSLADRRVARDDWTRYERAHDSVEACTVNGLERVNLTTGESTVIWQRMTPGKESTRYHDIDRLNDTHVVVADIYLDRVFVLDTRTGREGWTWNATSTFSTESGGPYPSDWTHINDVEILPSGRIMVSVRNQDQVVFLNESGVVAGWTLGKENARAIIHEQHNPDYIPAANGGPAVLVADSENNRVVEYERSNASWTRTWTWRDRRLQWPRDADRLPSGNTLIADSNGNRIIEVDRDGEVVWAVNIAFPYEVERVATGDESTGGQSATRADLSTQTGSIGDRVIIHAKALIPGRYLNGLMYVTPVWMGIVELFGVVIGVLVGVCWMTAEGYWRSDWRLSRGRR